MGYLLVIVSLIMLIVAKIQKGREELERNGQRLDRIMSECNAALIKGRLGYDEMDKSLRKRIEEDDIYRKYLFERTFNLMSELGVVLDSNLKDSCESHYRNGTFEIGMWDIFEAVVMIEHGYLPNGFFKPSFSLDVLDTGRTDKKASTQFASYIMRKIREDGHPCRFDHNASSGKYVWTYLI